MQVCGVDDAGRGPVIGPLVIAGVTLDKTKIPELVNIGVKDSKMLRPNVRTRLSKEILDIVTDHFIVELDVSQLDKVVHVAPKLQRLNLLEARAMAQVIEQLKPDTAIVDASDVKPMRFRNNILESLSYKPRVISEHNADVKYPVVSAASILAKVRRDQRIDEIKHVYGDFGSGYVHDKRTINYLYTYYMAHHDFPPIVRRSWVTLRNIVNDLYQSRLL
jgi:ribonuclease HII